MPFLESIGIPADLVDDIGEFGKAAVTMDTVAGDRFQGELGDFFGGEEKLAPRVAIEDISSFHYDATDTHHAGFVRQVPLAWVNRLVVVELFFGEALGLVSDETVRDCERLHLQALPGRPALAPIPVSLVRGVALVPKAVHASLQHSPDGQYEVRKYILQQGECITVRELHVKVDLEEEFKRIAISEEFGGFPVEEVSFHMLYNCAKYDQGYVCSSFYRFPAPLDDDAGECAENEDWRLKWAVPNHHLLHRKASADYFKTFDSDVELLREGVDDQEFPKNEDLCKICEARVGCDGLDEEVLLPAPLFDPMDILRTREPTSEGDSFFSSSNS